METPEDFLQQPKLGNFLLRDDPEWRWRVEKAFDPSFEGAVDEGKVVVSMRNLKGTHQPFVPSSFQEIYKTWKYVVKVEIMEPLFYKDMRASLLIIDSEPDASGNRRVKEGSMRSFEKGQTLSMYTEMKAEDWKKNERGFLEVYFTGVMASFCSDSEGLKYRFRVVLYRGDEPLVQIMSAGFKVFGRARVHHYMTDKAKREGLLVIQPPRKKRRRSDFPRAGFIVPPGDMGVTEAQFFQENAIAFSCLHLMKSLESKDAMVRCIQFLHQNLEVPYDPPAPDMEDDLVSDSMEHSGPSTVPPDGTIPSELPTGSVMRGMNVVTAVLPRDTDPTRRR